MKKKLAILTLFGFLAIVSVNLFAQDESAELIDSVLDVVRKEAEGCDCL